MRISVFDKLMFTWVFAGGISMLTLILLRATGLLTDVHTFNIAMTVWVAPIAIVAFAGSIWALICIWRSE